MISIVNSKEEACLRQIHAMVDSPEKAWRRQIHTFLLSRGAPVTFQQVGLQCMKPADVIRKLGDVIRNDSRFLISGIGHGISVSSAGAGPRSAPPPAAATLARQPPPPDFPRHLGREACPFYIEHGWCRRKKVPLNLLKPQP